MGLSIFARAETDPIPRATVLELTCDAPSERAPATARFEQGDYVAQRAAATAAGWLERQTQAGRIFLCPDCARR